MGLFLPGDERRWASYDLEVAEKLGLNEAIVLGHIIRSIEYHINHQQIEEFFRDGRWWMYDGALHIAKKTAIGIGAVKRALKCLRDLKILGSSQFKKDGGECHNWYSIDAQNLVKVLASPPPRSKMNLPPSVQNEPTPRFKMNLPSVQNEPTPSVQNGPLSLLSITNISNIETNIAAEPMLATITPLKIKKPRPKKERFPIALDLFELGKAWLEYATEELDGSKPHRSWNAEFFAEGIGKVMKATGYDLQEMWTVLKFVRIKPLDKSEFSWYPNATSPHQLLKESARNGKRKIDNIRSSMNQPMRSVYERSKAVDLSADNGKYAAYTKDTPF